ncbi:MCE family protein [Nocardioides sp. R1-1]|uniref:MCE family protein n=1 Tax=Nocardioides sp. R1-1 TaxID=3383502 RepID=UPI0038D12C78
MSELLFPHTRLDAGVLRLRLAAVGLVGGLLLALVLGILGLKTLGVLSGDVRLTVQLPTVGDTLGINSDVKFNGLRVGRVVEVRPTAERGAAGWDGPSAEVLVQREHAGLIPAAVAARVLPGTLFGNEYVDLVPAATAAAPTHLAADAHLTDGDVVPADTSAPTLRLMDTFTATQRLLAAIDPAQWDVALSQLAAALDGRGADLGRMVREGDALLARWTDLQPQLRRDLDLLTADLDLAADIEPALVQALENSRPLARTLAARQEETAALLQAVPHTLDGEDGVTAFLRAHGGDVARLLNATAATLEAFAERHPAFARLLEKVPPLLRNGAAAVKGGNIQMEGVISPALVDAYDGGDCPAYRGLAGPCAGGSR